MKKGTPLFKNRKLRYGSLSVTLTAAIIAAVVIINVIFTHLASKHLWVIDMTSDGIYSLTEAGITYLDKTIESANDDRSEKGEDPVKVKLLFCDEPDALEANELQRIVYVMAKELQNQFPDTIEVDWVDIIKNPSAVQSYGNPKTTSVIVISGTEYRTVPLTSFYVFDSTDSTEPWAYKVERTFAINIAGVTRAESPIACWTTNHGELAYDNEILSLITDAGYILQPLDLAKEDIPADCRLIVTYKPTNDFLSSKDGVSSISEVEKLDAFLDDANSYMVFTDADTPVLPNLEEYLEEWGISYARMTETDEKGQDKIFPYMIKDSSQSLSIDGYTFIGEYETKGFGASVTSTMREGGVPKKVIFRNASTIVPSKYYEVAYNRNEDSTSESNPEDEYYYYTYYGNGISRSMYNIFTTSANAVAMANGKEVDAADEFNKFSLMTITAESHTIQDDNYNTQTNNSYVLACSSTEALSGALLQSAVYGNSDLLMSTMRTMGREIVPVGLSLIPFSSTTMETITTTQATQYTVALTVIPSVIMFGLGIFVMVRRKYS